MIAEIRDFLGCDTPTGWVSAALAQQDVMLIDHKNCELKAAATAFHLIGKHGNRIDLVNKLSRLAREELRHFEQVMAIIGKRGIPLVTLSASRYARSLRDQVTGNDETGRLVDVLVIGAFIEARSCERFAAVAPHLDEELGRFYTGLLKSESRHFGDYLGLAERYGGKAATAAAVERIRPIENALVLEPDREFRFHSGVPA